MTDTKAKIFNILKSEKQAALSYLHGDQPRSAIIDFSETEELEILFVTLTGYRKYEDLKKHPKVSLVLGGKDNITVQYEGVAEELSKLQFLPYLKYHLQKNPVEAKFSEMLEARFFKVHPAWVRYADYGQEPYEIHEINFPENHE